MRCHTGDSPLIVGLEGMSALSNKRKMKGFLQRKVLTVKKKVISAGVLEFRWSFSVRRKV
jgi:hypothetical protein